ncbi:hypothetical protein [Microbispora hainanensis]
MPVLRLGCGALVVPALVLRLWPVARPLLRLRLRFGCGVLVVLALVL